MNPETRTLRNEFALGLALSLLGGLALLAGASQWGSFGWGFVLGIPVTVGFVLGYNAGPGRALKVFFTIFLVIGLIAGALTMQMAGLLCGTIAACIMIVPTALGILLGGLARHRTGRRAAIATSLLLLAACGTLVYGEALLEEGRAEEEIITARILEMAPLRAWEVLTFYEEVDLEPPLFARIGLPHPLRTEGPMTRVGDVTRCIYSTGFLKKRITSFEPGRELAFEVIEQKGVEDRSVELLRGSFRFEPLADGRTRVILSTVYRPLLAARPAWRPFERRLAQVLHEHVLDGMEHEHHRRGVALAQRTSVAPPRP
jgi:hypothetical protein